MKKTIFILSFIGLILSINAQNTVKLKTIQTQYVEAGYNLDIKGELNGAVINIDTLPIFFPLLTIVNISNDTFFATEMINLQMFFYVYDNTDSILFSNRTVLTPQPISSISNDWYPNDTTRILCFDYTFSEIIEAIESTGVSFDEISYWVVACGVHYTSKDGTFTDSVFFAGADIATFYVIRNDVSIHETEQTAFTIYPNPAQTQFTVTNTENASITLHNILGQEVKRTQATAEQTTIYTDNLPAGIYVLKVEKEGTVFTKKVQISD